MLEVARFAVAGTPLELMRRRFSHVELDGLQLYITKGRGQATALRGQVRDVHVDTVAVRNGRLVILPDDPRKLPLEFGLQDLTLTDFGFDRSTAFAARLVNPKPRALIQTEGRFGPWRSDAPRSTPVSGVYLFHDGDLDVIKGIGGHMTSSGRFDGVLERLAVQGTTTSPDFQLDLARQPVPLRTAFKATVDGTRGDTFLDDVDATLGQSRIRAHGSVASTPGAKGRTVTLTVTMKDARFEDLLRLSVKAQEPPMRGRLDIDTGFDLPPGDEDVPQRLRLKGRFAIRGGRFANDTAQNKIDELSRRGRGEPGNAEVSNVISAFGGAFALQDGVLRLPGLRFSVVGARVDLDGRYTLRDAGARLHGRAPARRAGLAHGHRVQVDSAEADRSAVPPRRGRHTAADQDLRHRGHAGLRRGYEASAETKLTALIQRRRRALLRRPPRLRPCARPSRTRAGGCRGSSG